MSIPARLYRCSNRMAWTLFPIPLRLSVEPTGPCPLSSTKPTTMLTNCMPYRTNITEQQLQGAPKYGAGANWDWQDTGRMRSVNDYYGVPY